MQNADLVQPALICNNAADLTCVYKPAVTGCSGSVNGQTSGWYGSLDGMGTHGRGQNVAYTDGHAKFRTLSLNTIDPTTTNGNVDPWRSYDVNGNIKSAWGDGCHIWLFRPNMDFQ